MTNTSLRWIAFAPLIALALVGCEERDLRLTNTQTDAVVTQRPPDETPPADQEMVVSTPQVMEFDITKQALAQDPGSGTAWPYAGPAGPATVDLSDDSGTAAPFIGPSPGQPAPAAADPLPPTIAPSVPDADPDPPPAYVPPPDPMGSDPVGPDVWGAKPPTYIPPPDPGAPDAPDPSAPDGGNLPATQPLPPDPGTTNPDPGTQPAPQIVIPAPSVPIPDFYTQGPSLPTGGDDTQPDGMASHSPEPCAGALLVIGAGALGWLLRRRRND